jgi:O-antigen/teichoic acid export membrane protein
MGIVAKQGIYSALNLVIGFAIGAFHTLWVVRVLWGEGEPKEMYGLLQLILTWGTIFSQGLNFGAISIAVRFTPKFRSEGRLPELNFISWVFPTVGMAILGLFLLFFGEWFLDKVTKDLSMEVGYLVLLLFVNAASMTYFRSLNGIAIAQFRNSLGAFFNEVYIRIVYLIGAGLFYYQIIDFHGLFLYYTLGQLSQFLVMFIVMKGFATLQMKVPANKKEFWELTRYGIYLVLDSGINILVNKIDAVMIGAILGSAEVVFYLIASYMVTVINLPARSLVNISAGLVSEKTHENDWPGIQKLYQNNSLHQFLLGGFIFLLILVNFKTFLQIYPKDFSSAFYVFLFLGIGRLFDLVTSINGVILAATPYYRYNLLFNSILVILAILTNFILIPIVGAVGAAIATAFCMLVYNLMKGIFLFRKYRLSPFHANSAKVLVCLIIPGLLGIFLPDVIQITADMSLKSMAMFGLLNIAMKSFVLLLVFAVLVYRLRVSEEINKLVVRLFSKIGIRMNG